MNKLLEAARDAVGVCPYCSRNWEEAKGADYHPNCKTCAPLAAAIAAEEGQPTREELIAALEKAATRVEHRSLSFNGERREFVDEIRALLARCKS